MIIFFNDTATTEIYTLSLHDALPISVSAGAAVQARERERRPLRSAAQDARPAASARFPLGDGRRHSPRRRGRHRERGGRSEEHTSELQSRQYLVCRLLLEKSTPDPAG